MLYDVRAARDNIRNSGGKRVFYLGPGDQLTPSARDMLNGLRVEICPPPPKGAPKPEHMTHLNGDTLVPKTHPAIAFRGQLDMLQAEILLCGKAVPSLQASLKEFLELCRKIMACDVLNETLPDVELLGLTEEQLRQHSHFPQKYYEKPHFMPAFEDSDAVLHLNKIRTLIRSTELSAIAAHPTRTDILQALNRMSSAAYILMIRQRNELKIDN